MNKQKRIWIILDDRYTRISALMTIKRTSDGYHEIMVCDAPVGAWENDETQNYESRIVFHPTRASWKAAYRIARAISWANPRLIANLHQQDTRAVICTRIAAHLKGAVLVDGYHVTDSPLEIEDREEIPT